MALSFLYVTLPTDGYSIVTVVLVSFPYNVNPCQLTPKRPFETTVVFIENVIQSAQAT